MAYQVLARKYRPQRFADVIGQDHVTVTLMNALTQQRIAHGYIFSGHRGIGKTTIARILAMALNCRNTIGSAQRPTAEPCEVCESCTEIRAGNAVDVIEIDAATNRGIDEIRELRDAARYRPSRDRYKIYILDEAHQITDAAFNALLKTLEEPPDHIVFMMATTQPEDIPQTVRSRCQHYSFHAVKLVDIMGQLRTIATAEAIDADDAALSLLAEAGDGSMRDALSIMDQAIASAPVEDGRARLDASQIRELMGTVPNAVFERILAAVDANQSAEVLTVANQLLDAGNSPAQLARQCVRYLRNCLIARIAGVQPDGGNLDGPAAELLQISADEQRRAARSAALFSEEELTRFLQTMLRTFDELGYRQEQRFHFELGLLKLVHLRRLLPVEEVLSKFGGASGSGSSEGAKASGASASGSASLRTSRAAGVAPLQARPSFTAAPPPPPLPPLPPAAVASPFAPPMAAAKAAFSPFSGGAFEEAASLPPIVPPVTSVVASTPAPVFTPPVPEAVAAPIAPSFSPFAESSAPVEPVFPSLAPGFAPPPLAGAPAAVFETPAPVAVAAQPVAAPIEERVELAPASVYEDEPVPAAPVETAAVEAAPSAEKPDDGGVAATLQRLAVDALMDAKGQTTAADAVGDAEWSIAGETVTVQTEVSKIMLPTVVNPEAEKIVRAAVVKQTPGLRVVFLPGVKKAAEAKKPRAAKSGSAQAKALGHPIVQEAQRLFHAEVRNVIDLTSND
jgi:DNA polymerase III subunit gamma/tau